jgi:Amt family ammonium transporter
VDGPTLDTVVAELHVTWVLVATVLVFFMQAGFALLEIGFSRGKNAGMGIAKILVNFSIASIGWWVAGFAIAFGGAGWLAGDSGWLFQFGRDFAGEPATGATARSSSSSSCSPRSRWRSCGARRSSG